MTDIIFEAVLDSLKALPFLFGAYLLIEYLEHRAGDKIKSSLSKMRFMGPIGGAALGCIPQCGISVAAANFYSGRLISVGTLLAVFIATSDEALPILLSTPGAALDVLRLIGVKLVAAVLVGLLADLVLNRFLKPKEKEPFHEICASCDCEHRGVLKSALLHTGKIFFFLLLVNLLLSLGIYFIGQEKISVILLSGSGFQPLLAALIGLIPNCASSVVLVELYLSGALSFGAAVAGLCTGAGMGILVLFKVNKKLKENLALVGVLYTAGVVTGTVVNLLFPK